ncbi:MAG: DMT family transporter [Candidatus Lustribacter sp.]
MTALQRGFWFALLAALAFGVTTPLIAALGGEAGPWSTAGWLYLGSALFAALAERKPRALVRGVRKYVPLLAAIALIGGMLAPAAYVIGLRDAGPFFASLALNMEAPFSVAIAAVAFHEYVNGRVVAAMLAIVAGASLLTFGQDTGTGLHAGVLLVVAATALWAFDNALSSRLGELDPRVTVFWKSAGGAALSLLTGMLLHEPAGTPATVAALLLIGAGGYGASLVLYLRAQRTFGVARTASVFATAPFIGAVGSFAFGKTALTLPGIAAFVAMAGGVYLHATERHAHRHHHHAQEHTHPHRHDDPHHDHAHEAAVLGEHTHHHAHGELEHTHEHAPDPEHSHTH